MKRKLILIATGLLLGLATAAPAHARESVIALSRAQAEPTLKAQAERALQHLLETLEPGEAAHFYDATGVVRIGTFKVPEGPAGGSARRVLTHNRATVAALGRFIRSAEPRPGHSAKIDLPGLLRSLRENQPAPESGADLIVLGHALHHPANASSQSMMGGRVPSDGHIVATPGQSVYGTEGLAGRLAGYDVYFGLIGTEWAISPSYAHHVARFWTLSVEAHGASMAYIGADLETLFARAGHDAPERRHAEPLRVEEKREMLTFAADDGAVPDLFRTPLQEDPAPEPVWADAASVTIGITWDVAGADLDLYVRPHGRAPVIYYAQADTAEGRLFKDFTLSPGTGFETVALSQAVDLSRMQLAVNYYGGVPSPDGVRGELRLAIGDDVWAVPIHIRAARGNRGAEVERVIEEHTVPSDAWILIDPLEVIGVR